MLLGCVLPDYRVFDDTTNAQTDDPAKPMDPPGSLLGSSLEGAPEGCNTCLAQNCQAQRAQCGDSCKQLKYPMSPAWDMKDDQDEFARCIVRECADACQTAWGCVGKYAFTEPSAAYNVTVRVTEANSDTPLKGAKVSACQGSDPGCSVGAGMESSSISDDDGKVTLTLRSDFFGYFLVDAGDAYFPTTFMSSQPTYRLDSSFTINVFPKLWLDLVLSQLMVKRADMTGFLIFRAENCLPLRYIGDAEINAEAEGVAVSFTPQGADTSRTFYTTYSRVVDPSANSTQAGGNSFGGAVNLPPAASSVVGSHDGRTIANATVRIRADALGLVMLVPNAR
jgi:hypothetical protein